MLHVPKIIKITNKVTEVIYCHCKAVASIMRATVFSVVRYTNASPSGYQRDRSGSRCPYWREYRHKRRTARGRKGQVRRHLAARSDTPHSSCLQVPWRRRCGSRHSRCSRWCRDRWLVVGVIFVADGRVLARLQSIRVRADAVTHDA